MFVEQCPLGLIDDRVWPVLDGAHLADKHGCWPILAGWLDQSASCVEAYRFIWVQESHWKAKLKHG